MPGLHDLNRSGAWLVVFVGVPILLNIILGAYLAVSLGTAIMAGQTPEEVDFMRFAGIAGVPPLHALLPAGLASALWYSFLIGAGTALGENWNAVKAIVEDSPVAIMLHVNEQKIHHKHVKGFQMIPAGLIDMHSVWIDKA